MDLASFPVKEPGCFMNEPAILQVGQGEDTNKIQRASSKYTLNDGDFEIPLKDYNRQYYSLYLSRLKKMRDTLLSLAYDKWGEKVEIADKILTLRPCVETVVVGTLYKDMTLRPSVLESYEKDRNIIPQLSKPKYVDETDTLVLEDESGRIQISGAVPKQLFTTGMVVVLKGTVTEGEGSMKVSEFILPGIPPQPKSCVNTRAKPSHRNTYVAIVSGLRVGDETRNPLQLQMFVDYITGHLGSQEEEKFVANIARLIIAGDSVVAPEASPEGVFIKNYQKKLTPKMRRQLIAPVQELDMVVSQLVHTIPVDVMPGANDPANFNLPQQPLNRCLLPVSAQYETYTPCTNPHWCTIGDTVVLGTSGQPINSMFKYTDKVDRLDLLEETLRLRHIAPTAPDLLGCYPFLKEDPFVLETCPHIYFAGNQPEFQTKLVRGADGQQVRLVCVPQFITTGTVVIVNLQTLEARPLTFALDETMFQRK